MGLYLIGSLLSFWTDPENLISVAKAVFGLGLVIFVHELGHFLVAKACGVKCEKFYVGFDVPIKLGPITLPSALFRKQIGETEYGVGIIPLGGYVKMLGQDDNPAAAAEENRRIRVKKENAAVDEDEYQLDPRSYPAKSVPQRMAIISAGVIMNLIFGVIFAAIAYKMGLSYTPCVIGKTSPGQPAWTAGLEPGDKIIQMGRDEEPSEHLRFSKELRFKVMETGAGKPLPLLIRRTEQQQWIEVTPSIPVPSRKLPTIGVIADNSNIVAQVPGDDFSVGAKSDLQPGDVIVEAAAAGAARPIQSYRDLTKFLLDHNRVPVQFVVEREADDAEAPARLEITVPPQPLRELGLQMTMGPIVAVRPGTTAVAADIQVGDVLVAVAGEAVSDPLLLDELLATTAPADEPIQLTLRRGGQDRQVSLKPNQRTQWNWPVLAGDVVSSEILGIAYAVQPTVSAVSADGPAAAAGIQPADVIQSVKRVVPSGVQLDETLLARLRVDQDEPLDAAFGWPVLAYELQFMPLTVEIELAYKRDGKISFARLQPRDSTEAYFPERGIQCELLEEIHTASTWSEAVKLGVRETKEGIHHVFFTLRKISQLFTSLGGPGTIAVVATQEASAGIPRLLAFLTLLSANLAVLNFLPIPVLDGGHMLFLIYEGIFGKPVNERIAFTLTLLGLGFILGLMVFVIWMDVYRFGFSG